MSGHNSFSMKRNIWEDLLALFFFSFVRRVPSRFCFSNKKAYNHHFRIFRQHDPKQRYYNCKWCWRHQIAYFCFDMDALYMNLSTSSNFFFIIAVDIYKKKFCIPSALLDLMVVYMILSLSLIMRHKETLRWTRGLFQIAEPIINNPK